MAVDADYGYDVNAAADACETACSDAATALQAAQDSLESEAPGGTVNQAATIVQLKALQDEVAKLARMVKHIKQVQQAESVTDPLS